MEVSQKCQYALRAIFELAGHRGDKPLKAVEIAKAQAIPVRFLEVILGELKRGGFVESRRGAKGGYFIIGIPKDLTVGQVIGFVEGAFTPVRCVGDSEIIDCPLHDNCVFMPMWAKARDAVQNIYDGTTFQDLIDEAALVDESIGQYSI